MDRDFYKQRALCVRDIASHADPLTKQRLLKLADNYDLKADGKTRASRNIETPFAPGRPTEG